MKGVILTIASEARIVDISHQLRSYSIEQGAFFLEQAANRFPEGTVHVVVVDPGVGSKRRGLAASAGGRYFVGPDNGVLSRALQAGKPQVQAVDEERYALKPTSRTFHGRDVFAPAAAWLAKGTPLSQIGPKADEYVRLPSLEPERTERGWRGRILNIDRFGNIVTNLPPERLAEGARLIVGDLEVTHASETYEAAATREPFAIVGSSGYLEISIRQDSAAAHARVEIGDQVELERPAGSKAGR